MIVDLGHWNGQNYLVLAGRDPGWSMGRPLKKIDTKLITNILEGWLLEDGKPVSICSDDGARFHNLFRQRVLNRWSKLSEQKLRFSSEVKIEKNAFNEK